jgi:hypothetical protein
MSGSLPMAKPPPTIPPFKVLLEMSGYTSLTHWMARPLSKEAVAALSPEARRERKRAQVRLCKACKRIERALASMYDANPTAAHDVLGLDPYIIT